MKYRIKRGANDVLPYLVQRQDEKSWFKIWWDVESFVRQYEAENFVKKCAELDSQHKVGKVIFEYDESDVIVDKLRNEKKNMEGVSAEGRAEKDSNINTVKIHRQKLSGI